MQKNYKAVFFDRDQTLTFFNPQKRQMLKEYIEENSDKTYDLPYETMMMLFSKAGYPEGGLKSIEAEKIFWLRYYRELLIHFEAQVDLDQSAQYLFSELWCNNDRVLFEESLEVLDNTCADLVDDYDIEVDGARETVTYYENHLKHEDKKHATSSKGLCPICHRPNGCAVVANQDPSSCWCMHTKVPQGLLEQIPQELRGESCVCQDCVERFNSK